MKVIGIDPALRNFGMVKGLIKNNELEIIDAVTFRTKPRPKKSEVSAGVYDVRCAAFLYSSAISFIESATPDLIIAEVGSGAQSHKAAAALGTMKGLIGALTKSHNLPWEIITPKEAKEVIRKDASKEEIGAWVLEKFPNYDWVQTKCLFEHQADAAIILAAGLLKLNILKEI